MSLFEGEFVDVQGVSKGKGFHCETSRFCGVGQATHGQHNRLRAPGSRSLIHLEYSKECVWLEEWEGENVNVQNLRVLKVVAEEPTCY
jgi:large subunit ribosomal protein L3